MKQLQQDIAVSLSLSYFSNHFNFIYITSVKIKIVSKRFTEPDSQQATVATKNSHITGRNLEQNQILLLMGIEGGGEYSLKYYCCKYC